jgi:hypothetical protein
VLSGGLRGAATSEQCRWAECGKGSRWLTALCPGVSRLEAAVCSCGKPLLALQFCFAICEL